MQVTKWLYAGEDSGAKVQLTAALRSMALGILCRAGAKQSKKYWGKDHPRLEDLVRKVNGETCKMVDRLGAGPLSFAEKHRLQQVIIVSSQYLMPPMRGKPFWCLELADTGVNSMSLCVLGVGDTI